MAIHGVSKLTLTACATLALVAFVAAGASFRVADASGSRGPTFGVVTQGPLDARDFRRMARGGVDTVRFLIRWRLVEPAAGAFDWTSVDPVVAGAAARGMEPLPIVYGSPPWVAEPESRPPIATPHARAAWRNFLRTLIERYGRSGSFWEYEFAGTGARPITRWQIWNEPNFDVYWHPRPSAAGYARLVRASSETLKHRDPRAEILLAGVAGVRTGVPWWRFLARTYRARGIRGGIEDLFDYVALHPYAPGIGTIARHVRLARRVMRTAGDPHKPLAITEIGWSSGRERAPLVKGRRGQARLLSQAFRLLRSHPRWRISDVDWYAWQDSLEVEAACLFCIEAGLFDFNRDPKPAWQAFRRQALSRRPSSLRLGARAQSLASRHHRWDAHIDGALRPLVELELEPRTLPPRGRPAAPDSRPRRGV